MSSFNVNITAYRKNDNKESLYNANFLVLVWGNSRELSDKTAKDGFFRSLDDLADAIQEKVLIEAERLQDFEKRDIMLSFTSKIKNEFNRAHIDSTGGYYQRELADHEMEKIVELTDSRLRPILYKK